MIINPHRFATTTPATAFDGFGNASRSFDGVDDYVAVPDNSDIPTGAQTWSCWVKIDVLEVAIFCAHWNSSTNQRSFQIYLDGSGKINVTVNHIGSGAGNKTVTSTSTVSTGTWYHITGVFSPSTYVKIFIDGIEDVEVTSGIPAYVLDSNADIGIGAYADSSLHFDGNLADVRIYDTDLSSSDIADLYAGTDIQTNLVGHWLKDTVDLLDHAGDNDGTNYGSKFSFDNPSPAVEFGNVSRSFDGSNDYVDLGDSDELSFGDGSNDSPFSISAWVKMTDATHFWIATKHDNSTQSEWLLAVSGDDKLYFAIYDGAVSVRRGLTSSSTFTSYENQWVHLTATYDGTGGTNADNGMTVYLTTLGGTTSAISTVAFNAGSYTAMHNGTKEMQIGAWTSNSKYANGNIADVRLYNKELSSAEVQSIADGTHVTTNLIGHWLTNNDDVDDYAGTNDGTNYGSTYSYDNPNAEVEYGQASRDFDGSNDYVDLGDVLDSVFAGTGKKFTISAWVKTTTLEDTDFLGKYNLAGQRSFICRVLSDGNLAMLMSGNGNFTANRWGRQTDTAPISADTWHHVAITYDHTATGDYLRMWVDGVEDTTLTDWLSNGTFTSIFDGTAQLRISGIEGNSDSNWGGNIADVRIYDTELTATEVYELAKGVDHRTNLVGQWLTNSDDVEDKAGTNDGTNYGSTYSTDSPL